MQPGTMWMRVTSLLLMLAWAVSPVFMTSHTYYISPNNNTTCNQSQFEACLTLQLFSAKNSSDFINTNVTLIFATGSHFLTGGVTFRNTVEVRLEGQAYGIMPEITCEVISCFSFIDASKVYFENLVFRDCRSENFDGGAIFAQHAQLVRITECLFINNFVTKPGGAIRIVNSSHVDITQSQFVNNSAVCGPADVFDFSGFRFCAQSCIGRGGAISVNNVTEVVVEDSVFDGNNAYTVGGALSSTFSSVSVRNTSFTRNTAVECSNGGGALVIFSSNVEVSSSVFQENQAFHGGAIFSPSSDSVVIIWNSFFVSNEANFFGGGCYFIENNLHIVSSMFRSNTANTGGALMVNSKKEDTSVISNSTFLSNTGTYGGALYLLLEGTPTCTTQCTNSEAMRPTGNESIVTITNCVFRYNGNFVGGAIQVFRGVVNITESILSEQRISGPGGTVNADSCFLYIQESKFSQNSCIQGGALYVSFGVLDSFNNKFIENNGNGGGGAIFALSSIINLMSDRYVSNTAIQEGGAISTARSYISIVSCTFVQNSNIVNGGAVSVREGEFHSVETLFINNSASARAGALFLVRTEASISGDLFVGNTATNNDGAAIFQTDGSIQFQNTTFTKNSALGYGREYIVQLTNARGIWDGLTFTNNQGSLYLLYSVVNFTGPISLTNNTGMSGGALTLVQSTVMFDQLSQVNISNNIATNGDGIFSTQSSLNINSLVAVIRNNTAMVSGGGAFCYQSQIRIESTDDQILGSVKFDKNRAVEGGAMYQVSTSLNIFRGVVLFSGNEALSRGGASFLSENSRIYILKTFQEDPNYLNVSLTFSSNTANYGGGLYVSDASNTGILCESSTATQARFASSNECFLQTLRLYHPRNFTFNQFNYFNIFFLNNTGNISGSDIFGGLLDRCQLNPFAEIVLNFRTNLDGVSYVKAITQFETYNPISPYNPRIIANSITREDIRILISSNATQLCFCANSSVYDCKAQHPTIFRKRGESFSIAVITVDQVENPVNSNILANVISSGTRLKVDQSRQVTNRACTELFYNVFSTQDNATIQLHPDGPCENQGISSKEITIAFLPCECPNGLQPAAIDNQCRCECDSSLDSIVSQCLLDNDNLTVVRRSEDVWIQYVNNDSTTGFVYSECPFDYCLVEPVNLNFSLPSQVDTQCAYNRSGVLCGECEEGLSLVFGSSRCTLCSNNYLALLIAFAVAGIALVAFIIILNLTVAVGTIHGLILYANIATANSPTFLPSETALRLFVSWVNLDLGIETCFYDGMESYAKVLLQVIFPSYVMFLSLLIILVSTYCDRFAQLIGRKNPVATLCTLFLLSYSKLLQTIIASLQFTQLTYPSGVTEVLWLYDSNIPYFTPARIPMFIIAGVILVLGTIYTVLLFCGQWLRKLRRVKCLQNNKYNAFIDAYHAPFSFKHRYWIGVLLLTRIIHHFLTAVLPESTHLLMVSCLVCALLISKQLITNVYKNWLLNFLESSFLINLLLFSVSTYYTTLANGDQIAVANTSVAIAFITFCGIVLFHSHTFFLKSFNGYQTAIAETKNCFQATKEKMEQCQPRAQGVENIDADLNHEHGEFHLNLAGIDDNIDIRPVVPDTYSNGRRPSEEADSDNYVPPPIVRLATRLDQLREPDLDILAPVTAEDYTQNRTQVETNRPNKAVTSTIVEI